MKYSLELLENKTLFFQSIQHRLKHGACGKVIFEANLQTIKQIINENN